MKSLLALGLFAAGLLPAQPLRVFSEFQRVDPFGEIVPPDRGGRPREILSPLVGRNAFTSYRLLVRIPEGREYTIYITQNPENAVRTTLYRELYTKIGNDWIPDGLEPVPLPYTRRPTDPAGPVPGQTHQSYWLDLWIPASARPGRFRLEAQLYFADEWAIYPMEVRVSHTVLPVSKDVPAVPPATKAPADFSARPPLRAYLCGTTERIAPPSPTVRQFIHRNVLQDIALARSLEPAKGREAIVRHAFDLLQAEDAKQWCSAGDLPHKSGPEWYLKFREYLLGGVLGAGLH